MSLSHSLILNSVTFSSAESENLKSYKNLKGDTAQKIHSKMYLWIS